MYIELRSNVDDYEHEGDIINQEHSLKNLGFKIIKIHYKTYDHDPYIIFGFDFNKESIERILNKLERQLEKCHEGNFHDYSEILNPYELEYSICEHDKKFNTNYYQLYKSKIDQLIKEY